MSRRVAAVFTVLIFTMGFMCLRIIDIGGGVYAKTANNNNTSTVTVATRRGTIYDCNMIPLTNTAKEYVAAVMPSERALSALSENLTQEEMAEILPRLQKGFPTTVNLKERFFESPDIRLFSVDKHFGDITYAPHIVGYLDSTEQNGMSGIEKAYNSWLLEGSGKISVTYNVNASGRILPGSAETVQNENYFSKQGVKLTVDSNIQYIAEKAAEENLESGTIIIMEAETRKLRAVVSVPNYNPLNVADALNAPDSPLINRAFSSYTLGSIFKLVPTAAALESGYPPEFSYTCTGSLVIGSHTFKCTGHTVHGWIEMPEAIARSCNAYFITLSETLGAQKILTMGSNLGLGKSSVLADGIVSDAGNLPALKTVNSPAAVANLAFGQGDLMVTPLQVANMTATLVTDGKYKEPLLVEALVDEQGFERTVERNPDDVQAVSPETAEKIREMLKGTVEIGTGKKAAPDFGGAGAKTATAQTGWYQDGQEVLHAWITGFYPADKPKYIITIMKEDGNGGGSDCGPIFKKIADDLYNCGYIAQ